MQSSRLHGQLAQMFLTRPPVSIGGWGNHVYLAGRLMGVDTGSGWNARVRVGLNGVATPGAFAPLPYPKYQGAECFYGANGVTAGADGKFVGVGGVSCIASKRPAEALVWRGASVTPLQSLVQNKAGWQLQDAQTINTRGQIAGTGRFMGGNAVFVLTPA